MIDIVKTREMITDIRNQITLGRMFRGFSPAVIALTGLFVAMHIVLAGGWNFLAGPLLLLPGSHDLALPPLVMGIPFAVGQGLMAVPPFTTLEVS